MAHSWSALAARLASGSRRLHRLHARVPAAPARRWHLERPRGAANRKSCPGFFRFFQERINLFRINPTSRGCFGAFWCMSKKQTSDFVNDQLGKNRGSPSHGRPSTECGSKPPTVSQGFSMVRPMFPYLVGPRVRPPVHPSGQFQFCSAQGMCVTSLEGPGRTGR